MSLLTRQKAFTLVELVIVVMIIGIIAIIALPKLINLKSNAVITSDKAVIASLSIAVSNKHLENIATGAGNVWPGQGGNENLFLLLDPPPKARAITTGSPSDANGEWQYSYHNYGGPYGSGYIYKFYCPHYRASQPQSSSTYIYVQSGTYVTYGPYSVSPSGKIYCERQGNHNN